MKPVYAAVAMMTLAGVCLSAAAQRDARDVDSKITSVTVYADRARTTRRAAVSLTPGNQILRFRKLPGWVDERSVRLAVVPATAGEIADVRMARVFLSEASDEQYQAAADALLKIDDAVNALSDERTILDARAQHIATMKTFSREKLSLESLQRAITPADYRAEEQYLIEGLRSVATARRELEKQLRELQPEQAAQRRRVAELQALRALQQTEITVTVRGLQAGEGAVELTYTLPGATWSPSHELRAESATAEQVELISFAEVTQTSGEDWEGAELSFSTQSPTSTMTIPELEALVLGSTRSSQSRQVMQQGGFEIAQQLYLGQNDTYNTKLNHVVALDLRRNRDGQEAVQQRMGAVFEELRDRGTTAHFKAAAPAAVRTDGRMVRVPLGRRSMKAKGSVVAAPQVSLNAVRTVSLVNGEEQSPLLPGRIGLYLGGAYLGPTEIDFVAPGERFAVFMGVEDAVKIQRVINLEKSFLDRGRRNRMGVHFDLILENLGSKPVTVTLTDRIPVSEKRDIRVERVRLDPKAEPAKDGLLKWQFTVAPGARQEIAVGYTISYPPDVVQSMRHSKGLSSAAPAAELDLSLQLEQLESNF